MKILYKLLSYLLGLIFLFLFTTEISVYVVRFLSPHLPSLVNYFHKMSGNFGNNDLWFALVGSILGTIIGVTISVICAWILSDFNNFMVNLKDRDKRLKALFMLIGSEVRINRQYFNKHFMPHINSTSEIKADRKFNTGEWSSLKQILIELNDHKMLFALVELYGYLDVINLKTESGAIIYTADITNLELAFNNIETKFNKLFDV